MTCCETGTPTGEADADVFMNDGDDSEAAPLPAAAQSTLDQIADALGVTTALLHQHGDTTRVRAGEAPSLVEVSALLRAYLRIEDREARQRCLDFVHAAAARP